MIYLFIPFVLQAILIAADEYIFHWKRGLPRWERIGHPLDTLSVLIALSFLAMVPFSATACKIYIALALFSCIFITKDEFVHKAHCPATEQWLHAVLFINHPILLSAAAWLWYKAPPFTSSFLLSQIIGIASFMLYQIIYWNWIWQEKKQ